MTEKQTATDVRVSDLGAFWFLVDAPMFVDSTLIERFHDAVLRPEYVVVKESDTTGSREEKERKLSVEGSGNADVPFVVGLALKGGFDSRFTREQSTARSRDLNIPRTPERLLEEIIAFYLAFYPQRILKVDPVGETVNPAVSDGTENRLSYSSLDDVCNVAGPRPLVLIDAPRGAKIMPMAGEFKDGTVEVIYDALVDELSTPDKPLKRFGPGMSDEDKEERWGELIERFDARKAMEVLEQAGKDHDGSRFEWIDFRMAWGKKGKPSPLHLHVCPDGRYSMGTFAHALVRRADSNGVRIVGTLKTGGDVNVLAIYER